MPVKDGLQMYRADDGARNELVSQIAGFIPQKQRESVHPGLFMHFAFQQLAGKTFKHETLAPALLTFAMAGLVPNQALGFGYLVPYGSIVTPVFGYRGMIELARRATYHDGRVLMDARGDVVMRGENFDLSRGIVGAVLGHQPTHDRTPTDIAEVLYAYAHLRYAVPVAGHVHEFDVVELMSRANIDAIKSKAYKHGPWKDWPLRMASKLPISRLCRSGRVPLGYLAGAMLNASSAAGAGRMSDYQRELRGALDVASQERRRPVGLLEDGLAAIDVDATAPKQANETTGNQPAGGYHAAIQPLIDALSKASTKDELKAIHARGVGIANHFKPDRSDFETFEAAFIEAGKALESK